MRFYFEISTGTLFGQDEVVYFLSTVTNHRMSAHCLTFSFTVLGKKLLTKCELWISSALRNASVSLSKCNSFLLNVVTVN